MKALNIEVLSKYLANYQHLWSMIRDRIWLILVLEGIVVFGIGILLLVFHFKKKGPQRDKKTEGMKSTLKSMDSDINSIRSEAQQLIQTLERLTGQSARAVTPAPVAAYAPAPTATSSHAETELWKRRADELQLELATTKQALAVAQESAQKAVASAITSGGAPGVDPNPALQAEIAKLQQEKTAIQKTLTETQTALTQAQEAAKSAASAPAGSPAAGGDEIELLRKKVEQLEKQLQEYAVIEEDIANIRILKTQNEQMKAQLAQLEAALGAEAGPAVPSNNPAPTQAAPAPAPTPKPAPTPEPKAAPAAAVEQKVEVTPKAPTPTEVKTAPTPQSAPTPTPAAAASAPPAADEASADPFKEFDNIMNEFDKADGGGKEPSDDELAAQLAAGSAPAEGASNEKQQFQGEPNKAIEEEFTKFVQ